MRDKVSIIAVSYNSGHVLPRFLRSIPPGVRTIIVDNASSDPLGDLPAQSNVTVLNLAENVGFGAACNLGASHCEGDLLIFTNPDILFSGNAIESLVAAAANYPEAAFNPRIYSRWRRKFRRRSRLIDRSKWWNGPAPNIDCCVPVLSGACLMVKREHFERIGGFDPKIFLFHEDDDLSARLTATGVELRLASSAIIRHDEGASSGRSAPVGRLKGEAMARSLVYVMKKYSATLDLNAECNKAFRKLISPHALLAPARWAKRRAFWRTMRLAKAQEGDPQW